MSTNEKAVARTTAVSKTTSASRHSTILPHWLVSLPTTAAEIAGGMWQQDDQRMMFPELGEGGDAVARLDHLVFGGEGRMA